MKHKAAPIGLALSLLTVLALATLTQRADAAAAATPPQIIIPDYPFWPNDTYTVSQPVILYQAENYCAAAPQPTAVEFFLGSMAYGAFDSLCQMPTSLTDELLGNLYLSGYFGGLWLRDNLGTSQAHQLTAQIAAQMAAYPESDLLDWLIFHGLVNGAGQQVTLARTGSYTEVLTQTRQSLPGQLSTFGYNLGYVEVLLENPPEGIIPNPNVLICGDYFLDCQSAYLDLGILDYFAPALTHLQNPDTPLWWRMDQLVQTEGVPAEAIGRAVWEAILADNPIAPAAYEPLLDLSAGFLLVSEATVLANMTAWAEQQPEAGRCGLLLNAGLSTWAGAYFMGLASDAPAGTFPELICQPE